MANNNNININITGDSTGLQNALTQSQNALNNFGSQAGGIAGEFSSTMATGLGRAATAFTGFAGAASIAGLSLAATFAAVQNASEKSFEVFKAGALSQTGIEQIQKMANLYRKVGLDIDKVADQNKDISDKLLDGLYNAGGSMYTDVIQPLKLNMLELQKMSKAGQDVYAKIYFAAKAQGMSAAEMTNMFETLGSDATLRLQVLKQFNTEQDYQNTLASQTVQLSGEQSASFEKYRDATNNLSNAWEQWNYSTLAPIADRLADILDLITSILNSKPIANAAAATEQQGIDLVKSYQGQFQNDLLANSSIYGAQLAKSQKKAIEQAQKNNDELLKYNNDVNDNMLNAFKPASDGSSKNLIENAIKPLLTSRQKTLNELSALRVQDEQMQAEIKKSLFTAYKGDSSAMNKALSEWTAGVNEKRESLNKALNKDAEDAKKKAEAAAKAAAAAAKKQNDEIIKATADRNKIISDMTIDSNLRQLAEFDRQQKAIVQSILDTSKKLGLDPSGLLEQQKISSASKRTDMTNNMIGYQDPNKGLKDTNTLLGSGNLSTQQNEFVGFQQRQRTSGNNPFSDAYGENATKLQNDNTEAMNLELKQNEMLLQSHEQYEQSKLEITNKYNAQAREIAMSQTQAQMQLIGGMAGDLGTIMAGAFGEGSKAAQAAFAVQKGITIAQTVLSIQSALAQALATPFPASLSAYAQVLSLGASIITTAKGAASGQFHGGVDSLPDDMNNKSFLLKAGERVVQPEANKKLTNFLDDQAKNGNNTSGDITINSPLIVQGNVDNPETWKKMLKINQNNVAQAVRSSQKRNT